MSPAAATVKPFYGSGPRTLPTQITITPGERDAIIPALVEMVTSDASNLTDRSYRAAMLAGDAIEPDAITVRDVTRNIVDQATALDILATAPTDQPSKIRHPGALAGLHRLVDAELERAHFDENHVAIEKWRPLGERLNVAGVS